MLVLLLALWVVQSFFHPVDGMVDVPISVQTLARGTSSINDFAIDGSGNILWLSAINNAVYYFSANGSSLLVAGSGNSTTGTRDGVGSTATFYNPYSITCDTVRNIVYISDYGNCRIRTLALATNSVTTLAGSFLGHRDGIGDAAWFLYTLGIAYHSSGVLYVTDSNYDFSGADVPNTYIRKIFVASANVTTVALVDLYYYYCFYVCINNAGTLLYTTSPYVVLQVNVTSGVVTSLAGRVGVYSYSDSVGPNAFFNVPEGLALNSDESALIIADLYNERIRRLEIATNNVVTIAGNGTTGLSDGPGLTATLNGPYGLKWHCTISLRCGVLVTEIEGIVRFVIVEDSTPTASLSLASTFTSSASHTVSVSYSTALTCSTSATKSMSTTHIRSHSTSQSATNATSMTTTVAFSRSASHSESLSHSMAMTTSFARLRLTLSKSLLSGASQSAMQSASVSRSRIVASKSSSMTGFSATKSASTLCALVPADGESSGGKLHPFLANVDGAMPLTPMTDVGLGNAVRASRLNRSLLLRTAPLVANLSLSLGGTIRGDALDGWELLSVAMDVLLVDSQFPLLTAAVPFTVLSTKAAGRTQSLVVLFDPPRETMPRWLPASLSTFRDVTLVLQLSVRCPANGSIIVLVTIVVPCPGEVQPLTSEVSNAASVARYSTSLAGPVTGGAVGRLASVRSLVLCSRDAVVEGLLPLEVDSCGDDGTGGSVASDARGGILGNLVLWAAVCALMAVAVVAYAHVGRTTLRVSAEMLGVPSPLLPLVVVTVPSTVSCTFFLLNARGCASDVVIGAVGFVMCVALVVVLCVVAIMVPRYLTLAKQQNHSQVRSRKSFCFCCFLQSVVFHRQLRWLKVKAAARAKPIAAASSESILLEDALQHSIMRCGTPARTWLRAATVLLLESASVWFAFVDVALLTTSSMLGALGMLESTSACRGSVIAILVLYVAQLALCAVLRPFTTIFSNVYALFTLALSCVAVTCQLWYLFGSTADNADFEELRRLLTAAAVCDLLVSGVSVLKAVIDISDGARACRRHLQSLCAPPAAPDDVVIMEDSYANQKRFDADDVHNEKPVSLFLADDTLPIADDVLGDEIDLLMKLVVIDSCLQRWWDSHCRGEHSAGS
ncbi:membrane-associated protein, putative [Bodo saltans]|uniref:Membrane-associated protein, putative n=1 Tax=Bodo saltans TaxID=75058 RepID=A0A0S4J645_BODSA|nr:membrane-associated protein, putative [Bodo saltans]|eukprot:CUG86924.1 membrane-associated protein, putative [Bodo saltans]